VKGVAGGRFNGKESEVSKEFISLRRMSWFLSANSKKNRSKARLMLKSPIELKRILDSINPFPSPKLWAVDVKRPKSHCWSKLAKD